MTPAPDPWPRVTAAVGALVRAGVLPPSGQVTVVLLRNPPADARAA